jgi:bifunctional UDP-N-acetylglucosamine pyrophosphorylase/glucosamine-1-phosphate N-acetyltransferase
MSIVVMAGGKGTRMNSDIPKVLHLFHEIPILVRILSVCVECCPSNIYIVVGEHEPIIQTTIEKYISYPFVYVSQNPSLGTAHAVACCLPFLDENENVLILNGDMPLIHVGILNQLMRKGVPSFAVARLCPAVGYGRVLSDKTGKVVGIREEKDCSPDELNEFVVNAGIYFFSSAVLREFIPHIQRNIKKGEYYLTDMIELLCNHHHDIHPVFIEPSFTIRGVNTCEELREAETYGS